MYKKHEMIITVFDDVYVFTDLGVSGDESGGIVVHSTNPGNSDFK